MLMLNTFTSTAGKSDAQTHKIQGYDRAAYEHLVAAYWVVSKEADVCLATHSTSKTFGLDFIRLHSERD